jgi:methylmalonyl-CoA mutase N-terminal domain/subunit
MGDHAMGHEYEKDSFKKRQKEWNEAREKSLAKSPERFDRFRTSTGSPVKPLYTPANTKEMSFSRDISFPGQYPYTRGVYPNGYRSQLWNIQQVSGYGLADDTNRRLKSLRSEGQHGVYGKDTINVVFDLPTHYGFDSDMPDAEGEVGRLGVVLDSLADMEMMLEGFRPDNTFVSFIVNHPAVIVLSMYIAYAEKMGVHSRALMGVMQNDPLSTFL